MAEKSIIKLLQIGNEKLNDIHVDCIPHAPDDKIVGFRVDDSELSRFDQIIKRCFPHIDELIKQNI